MSAINGNSMTMPTKLPFVYTRVVRACVGTTLSPTNKLVWLEHYGLTNGKAGATISANGLGRRIGVSRATVERARHELLRMGLIRKRDRGIGRTDSWFVQLPSCAQPQAKRITDDEVEKLAEELAKWIESRSATSLKDEGGSESGTSRTNEGGWGADDEPPSPLEGGSHSMASHFR